MSVRGDNAPVIIIKRKKVIKGSGHHGGAWKVAYADFVTAMMAFFLLMWLLNATTEKERRGLADYFSPTIQVFRATAGGEGAFGGDSTLSQDVLIKSGTGASGIRASDANRADGDTGVVPDTQSGGEIGKQDQKFTEIDSLLRGNSGESTVADELLQHVSTRVTDEGLIIDLFDLEESPLFEPGSSVPTKKMEKLLDMVSGVISIVSNKIAVTGHTDSRSVDGRDPFILSANRAQLARQRLLAGGIDPARITRVTGNADRSPASPSASVYRNRRVEITLLRR